MADRFARGDPSTMQYSPRSNPLPAERSFRQPGVAQEYPISSAKFNEIATMFPVELFQCPEILAELGVAQALPLRPALAPSGRGGWANEPSLRGRLS
jgi:hypothetical protein